MDYLEECVGGHHPIVDYPLRVPDPPVDHLHFDQDCQVDYLEECLVGHPVVDYLLRVQDP